MSASRSRTGTGKRTVTTVLALGLLVPCAATLLAQALGSSLDPRAALAVLPAAAIDAGLAVLVLPLVTRTLRSPVLRPAPEFEGHLS